MHLQLFHTNHFCIKSTKKSNRPSGIISFNSKDKKDKYYNSLVVFASIEKGDSLNTCDNAVNETFKIFMEIQSSEKCKAIVIVAYSHQSNIETDSKKTLKFFQIIFNKMRLKYSNIPIYFGDFGYSKEWEINVKSHKLSCLYRRI